ncbi:Imm1 family immunity protein [Kitasatospora sp. NPDC057512]|uniref:Imm1 family immunity protein n=1 Tax=Kitasatospora sp. NPDC057512 TaxID=3346154 RepID=UPI0036766158
MKMELVVYARGGKAVPGSPREVEEAVDQALTPSISPNSAPWAIARFALLEEGRQVADSNLSVSVNPENGYGALVWGVDGNSSRRGGIYDFSWISDNPDPPGFDPVLVSDPCFPRFHSPRSALPVEQIREAILEFCRSPFGERPECITWVTGELNGVRHDDEPEEGPVEDDSAWLAAFRSFADTLRPSTPHGADDNNGSSAG